MDIVIFEGIVRFKGSPILLGDTASPSCGQQAGLFTCVGHPRTVLAQGGHTTTSSHLTRPPGAYPGGEDAVIISLWGWPLEGDHPAGPPIDSSSAHVHGGWSSTWPRDECIAISRRATV